MDTQKKIPMQDVAVIQKHIISVRNVHIHHPRCEGDCEAPGNGAVSAAARNASQSGFRRNHETKGADDVRTTCC